MTGEVVVRAARSSDHSVVEALFVRASLANEGDRNALLEHPEVLQIPIERLEAGNILIAERNGVVVGFASVATESNAAELVDLFVEPRTWKQGIGRRLVDEALDRALAQGCDSLMVVGNPHSEGFYGRCGFQVAETVDTRFGPGLRMRRAVLPR